MKKNRNIFLIIFSILGLILPFFSFSFESNTKLEEISSIFVKEGSESTTTHSLNLNIKSKEKVEYNEFVKTINYCNNYLNNNTSNIFYTVRTVLNSKDGDFLKLKVDSETSYSMMPHLTRGDIHLNPKNEFVFGNYEVKVYFNKNTKIDYKNFDTFCEIRSSLADKILLSLGKTPSIDNYEWLIDSGYALESFYKTVNYEKQIRFQIMNIIIEHEGNDDFYKNTFGDYILFYPNQIKDFSGCAISADFGSSLADTKTFLKNLLSDFSKDKYVYQINHNNFKNNNFDYIQRKLDGFLAENKNTQKAITDTLIRLSVIVVFLLISIIFWRFKISTKQFAYYFGFYFILYNMLMILDKLFPQYFSQFFTLNAIIYTILFFVILIAEVLLLNKKKEWVINI